MAQLIKVLLASLALTASSCTGKKEDAPGNGNSSGKPQVLTTFYPTQYFALRMADGVADVVCPVPDDADPIFWKPDAETIARYQRADLIILNGAGFAKWVEQTNLPESRTVDTSASFAERFIQYEDAVQHKHGPEGAHTHEGTDGHTWVDPVNALAQATAIKDALIRSFPDHEEEIGANFDKLKEELASLDAEFKKVSADAKTVPLLASHPAYNYIAQRYGWNIRNLDLDPEEMPDDETLEEIGKLLESHAAKTILWEGAPTDEIAARVKEELGLVSVEFSPCELAPEAPEDYLSVMRRNLEVMRGLFGK